MTTPPGPGPTAAPEPAAPESASPESASLTVGEKDATLEKQLNDGLDVFNAAASGFPYEDKSLSVRVDDASGALVGGLTGWIWGGLCGIDMLWIREDSRHEGWGGKLLAAAEAEAARRGCDRVIVSSFTFQAPAFYARHGYVETGRSHGIPGGHSDVHFFKSLGWAPAAD